MTRAFSDRDGERYNVLLVEDEPADISPFIDSFNETDATEEVYVVTDGDEALDFIHQRGSYTQTPRPDLIILDPYIPGSDGERLLRELHNQPELRSIPVLVFTTSAAAEDVARSYELNANAYLQKPTTAEEFITVAQAIEDFWLKLAHLPPT